MILTFLVTAVYWIYCKDCSGHPGQTNFVGSIIPEPMICHADCRSSGQSTGTDGVQQAIKECIGFLEQFAYSEAKALYGERHA